MFICFLKNKGFGSLGELFISSYRAKKGLVLLALVTKDLYLLHRSRKSFQIKTLDLLRIPRCQDADGCGVGWVAGESDLNIRLLELNRRHRWQPATDFKF